MADREKVISTFEKIISVCKEDGCDFVDLTFEDAEQILAMLKEQEAVEPRVSTAEQRCGHCNKVIEMDGWQSCPWCGKHIDWKGWWKKNGTRNQDS